MGRMEGRNVIVETSVWLALCLDMHEDAEDAQRFLTAATGKINLLVTTTSMQDLWWGLRFSLRKATLARRGELSAKAEIAIDSAAWDSVEFVRGMASVVPTGSLGAEAAESMRKFRLGYAHALLIAAAQECRASSIVSFNEDLHDCMLTRCLYPSEAIIAYDI